MICNKVCCSPKKIVVYLSSGKLRSGIGKRGEKKQENNG